jgi:lipid A 3-O-deacylase
VHASVLNHPKLWFGAAFVASLVTMSPAVGQSLEFGLIGDVHDEAIGGSVSYHTAPVFSTPGGVSGAWGAAARVDSGENAWVGAGFILNFPLSQNAFVETSFMPGYYHEGDRDLGGNLHFRSLIGVGWSVSPNGAVVLSLDHLSNGGLEERNPGTETLTLGYRMAF